MTVRSTEARIPVGFSPSDLGEATAIKVGPGGKRFVLISYLTSPVVERTRLDYVVFALPQAGTNEDFWVAEAEVDEYRWTVTRTAQPDWKLAEGVTDIGVFHWTSGGPETFKLKVEVVLSGAVITTLELTQTIKPRDPWLEDRIIEMENNKAPATQGDAIREPINELRDYIIDAAKNTGEHGVPASFVAAIVFMEIWGRPKEGTANARSYRRRAGNRADPTWSEWTEDELRKQLGLTRAFGHIDDIRCVELALVADAIDDKFLDRRFVLGGKSIGVGQIALSTAAMALEISPWLDQPYDGSKQQVRDEIDDNWQDIVLKRTQVGIFNWLRFPKANIALAARLLTKIKNRQNRWPELTAPQFLATKDAVRIVATEYNMGATNSPRDKAKHNGNGKRAWDYVQRRSVLFPTRYFPTGG